MNRSIKAWKIILLYSLMPLFSVSDAIYYKVSEGGKKKFGYFVSTS